MVAQDGDPATRSIGSAVAGKPIFRHDDRLRSATADPSSESRHAQEEGADETQSQESGDSATAVPDAGNAAMDPPRLILVGWTPSQLSRQRPQDLDRVSRNIVNIGSCLGVDLVEVFVWQPAAAEIRRIAFCLTKGSRKDVTKAILDSLDQSGVRLTPCQREKGSSGDLLESRARLREALSRPGSGADCRRRQLREYQQAVDSTFVDPVLKCAVGESDSDERSRLGCLAAVNRLLHPSVELYSAKLEREITRGGLRGSGEGLQTRELLKIFDVVYKLTKERK